MRLIFMYGPPAAGKLTVAQELKLITGFPVFHNHLVVDLLTSLFSFGSEPFVVLREQMWLSVFEQAARAALPGLIFTFAPEATVRPAFLPAAVETIENSGGTVDFVELICPEDEIKRRLDHPARRKFGKLTSHALYDELKASGSFEVLTMPAPKVRVDTSVSSPARAALEIARALKLV
jgi:chloramphenicol 3-O-phosphotransferase